MIKVQLFQTVNHLIIYLFFYLECAEITFCEINYKSKYVNKCKFDIQINWFQFPKL